MVKRKRGEAPTAGLPEMQRVRALLRSFVYNLYRLVNLGVRPNLGYPVRFSTEQGAIHSTSSRLPAFQPSPMRFPAAPLLLLLVVAPQAASAQPGTTLADRLDRIVEAAHVRDAFDGVVLVGRGDSVVYARAIGTADRA